MHKLHCSITLPNNDYNNLYIDVFAQHIIPISKLNACIENQMQKIIPISKLCMYRKSNAKNLNSKTYQMCS